MVSVQVNFLKNLPVLQGTLTFISYLQEMREPVLVLVSLISLIILSFIELFFFFLAMGFVCFNIKLRKS